jgi:hypothetical protein
MCLFHWRGICLFSLMDRQMCVFIGGTGNWSKSEQGPEGCVTWRAGARTCQGVLWLPEVSSSAASSTCSVECVSMRTPCPELRTFTSSCVLNLRKCHFTSDACYVTARWWSYQWYGHMGQTSSKITVSVYSKTVFNVSLFMHRFGH